MTGEMILRPYKPCDAEKIVSWIKDEIGFRKWCSDRFESFPLSAGEMNECYLNNNGGCEEPDNFYPVTATVNGEAVGHLILRYRGEDKSEIRFGFVIVDDTKRGQGYGKKMLQLAEKYAFEILKARTITLGVFENNPDAFYCYQAAGFERLSEDKDFYFDILGEKWKCMELALGYGSKSRGIPESERSEDAFCEARFSYQQS